MALNNAYLANADLHLKFAGTDDGGLAEFQRLSLDAPADPATAELLRRLHDIFPDVSIREIIFRIRSI